MAIRVGKVEIKATQRVEALEARALVGLRVPGQAGGVQQNLGREPVLLVVEGLLFGANATKSVEALRAAYATGDPQPFTGDIAVGVEFTDVIVEDLRLVQVAGTLDRYEAALRLREHTEPPERPNLLGVDLSIVSDVADWVKVAMTLAAVAQDPRRLLDELKNNPLLRDKLGIDRLEQLACEAAGEILGVHPDTVRVWAAEVEGHAEDVVAAVEAIADAPDLLPQLQAVAQRAAQIVKRVTDGSLARAVAGEGGRALDLVVRDLEALAKATRRVLENRALGVFTRSVARSLGIAEAWNGAVEDVSRWFAELAAAVRGLIPWVEQADALLAVIQLLTPAMWGVASGVGAFSGQLERLGAPMPSAKLAGALADLVSRLEGGAAIVGHALPSPAAIRSLATALDPELRQAVLQHRAVA